MRKLYFIILLILFTASLRAQLGPEGEYIRQRRFKRIDYYHITTGLSFGFNNNHAVGPRFSLGIGTFRNTLNFDVGFRYLFVNPFHTINEERISMQQTSFFLSFCTNVYSWNMSCLYLGAEFSYNLIVNSHHHLTESSVFDRNLGHNHFASMLKTGLRINDLDFAFFFLYRLGPLFNQKYIFESSEYDYDILHDQIFERMMLGVELTYHFAI